jgi:hypothetical protein
MRELHESEFISGEINCVGDGIGGGFTNTNKLKVVNFKEALLTKDVPQLETAVDEEHDIMVKHSVWLAILKWDIPAAAKILSSTWAMKKKANKTNT